MKIFSTKLCMEGNCNAPFNTVKGIAGKKKWEKKQIRVETLPQIRHRSDAFMHTYFPSVDEHNANDQRCLNVSDFQWNHFFRKKKKMRKCFEFYRWLNGTEMKSTITHLQFKLKFIYCGICIQKHAIFNASLLNLFTKRFHFSVCVCFHSEKTNVICKWERHELQFRTKANVYSTVQEWELKSDKMENKSRA